VSRSRTSYIFATTNLPACPSYYPFNAERQAGKLASEYQFLIFFF